MCEPLKGKGRIDNQTRAYLELRWFKPNGDEYKGNMAFDEKYNAFGKGDIPLVGKYFDEDGKEVKHTAFSVHDVKSAVEGLKKEIKHTKELYIYPKAGRTVLELINKWFEDVIDES